ncbi:hypothetical protein BGLA2_650071 [Burkholderia gladioli]|nr:hypothetical protein BGLA2_650071 [Burkholderia gladioli]
MIRRNGGDSFGFARRPLGSPRVFYWRGPAAESTAPRPRAIVDFPANHGFGRIADPSLSSPRRDTAKSLLPAIPHFAVFFRLSRRSRRVFRRARRFVRHGSDYDACQGSSRTRGSLR